MAVTHVDTPFGENVTDRFRDVWEDQRTFNLELRPAPQTDQERSALASDLSLHLIAETIELLRCVKWKKHRRQNGALNLAHIREEVVDMFKMFMTVAQIWGMSPDELMNAYWEKSAVVRQRHAEEWIRNSQQPSAVIDLDNCLADFSVGMACWLHDRNYINALRRRQLIESRPWIDGASAGYSLTEWTAIKHEFNTTGGFRTLPMMAGAKVFVEWCRDQHLNVVILTSRPIDVYPNILTDTVFWFKKFDIHADFIWWGDDKDKKLHSQGVLEHVQFAVDDDQKYVTQFCAAGVPVFWLRPGMPFTIEAWEGQPGNHMNCFSSPSLLEIMERYHAVLGWRASPAR